MLGANYENEELEGAVASANIAVSDKYYTTIEDLPLYNWRKCQENDEYQYCRKNVAIGNVREDSEAWEVVYNSYLAEFGFSTDYIRAMEIQEEMATLQCDFIIEDRLFILNRVKRLERELEELINTPGEGDMDTCITYLSKWLGFRLNPKETTVREFYKYLRAYDKEAEAMKKRN